MLSTSSLRTLWIVDDIPANCARYRDLLIRHVDCPIEVCHSKHEALACLQSGFIPSVVVLDVGLPDPEDGLEVCRAIKQSFIGPEVQVLMVTALRDSPNVLQACIEAGADDFLGRGRSNQEIIARVQGKLRTHEAIMNMVAAQQELIERKATIAEFIEGLHHDVRSAVDLPKNLLSALNTFIDSWQEFKDGSVEDLTNILAHVQCLKDLSDAGGEEVPSYVGVRQKLTEVFRGVKYKVLREKSVIRLDCNPDLTSKISVYWPNMLLTLQELIINAATIIKQDRFVLNPDQPPYDGVIILSAESIKVDGAPWVRIVVADNGPGVREDLRATLFDYGVTSRREAGGTGRGLYFAKQRIVRAGGDLRYEPNDPVGAKFIIELPAVVD